VNLTTAPFSDAPRSAVSLEYGSYETKRLMAEMSSGPLAGGWNLYGRYSRVESFGYLTLTDVAIVGNATGSGGNGSMPCTTSIW